MDAPQRRKAPWLRWLPGLGVGGIACLLLLREVDFWRVAAALERVQVLWALAALGCATATVVAKALRWRSLAGAAGQGISPRRYLAVQAGGMLLNQAFPARVGDVARAWLLGRAGGAYGEAIGSVLVEKAMDSLVLLAFLAALLPFVPFPPWLQAGGKVFALGLLLLLGVLLALAFLPLEKAIPWQRLRLWLARFQVVQGLQAGLRGNWRAWPPWCWTASVWALGGMTNLLAFRALGLPVGVSAAAFLMAVVYLGRSVPAPPGQVGVFQVLCAMALAPFGIGWTEGVAVGILLHGVVLGPIVGMGVWGMASLGWTWGEGEPAGGAEGALPSGPAQS